TSWLPTRMRTRAPTRAASSRSPPPSAARAGRRPPSTRSSSSTRRFAGSLPRRCSRRPADDEDRSRSARSDGGTSPFPRAPSTRSSAGGARPMSADDVLTPDATEFLHLLQRELGGEREELLASRHARAERLRAGELPDFLNETRAVREGDWRVPPAPPDLA